MTCNKMMQAVPIAKIVGIDLLLLLLLLSLLLLYCVNSNASKNVDEFR